MTAIAATPTYEVTIPTRNGVLLPGVLSVPERPVGAVLFPHAGSSDLDPRNSGITDALGGSGLATLTFDLLTPEEAGDRENVFDVPLLADRLRTATKWLGRSEIAGELPFGYLAAGTAACASLWAAADPDVPVRAIVSLGCWADRVGERLARIHAPTLLVVGGVDAHVLELNRRALDELGECEHELAVIPGATHNFEQFGALEQVDEHAIAWFAKHLSP